jgi:CDP-diacylglycerol---serine O-phosphatidyltransferase
VKRLSNLITSVSLLLGFLSIIFSFKEQFNLACWGIILAAALDGIDGQVARKFFSAGRLGKELDSLTDLVCFGVAPVILGYAAIHRYLGLYLYAAALFFLYLFCSVARLAKYNITPQEELTYSFSGLPVTVSGGMLASFILIFWGKEGILLPAWLPVVFTLLVLTFAFLMVSSLKYLNLNGIQRLLGVRSIPVLILAGLFLAFCLYLDKAGLGIFSLFLAYLFLSPFVARNIVGSS